MMRSLFLLGLAACAAPAPGPGPAPVASAAPASFAPAVGSKFRIDAELGVQVLAKDTYLVTHEPFHASNVLVARMPDGTVVVCSSPFDTEAARALVHWVQGTLQPTRMIAINTHFHLDGSAGNEAYRELGVVTYASEHTRDLIASKGPAHQQSAAADFEGAQRQRIERIKLLPPDHVFSESEGLTFDFGGERVRVMYPGPGHSADNVVVLFAQRDLLFGGCLVKGSASIGFVGDADLNQWEASVAAAGALDAHVVIPGHGAVGGSELFDLTFDVVRRARHEAACGKMPAYAVGPAKKPRTITMPAWPDAAGPFELAWTLRRPRAVPNPIAGGPPAPHDTHEERRVELVVRHAGVERKVLLPALAGLYSPGNQNPCEPPAGPDEHGVVSHVALTMAGQNGYLVRLVEPGLLQIASNEVGDGECAEVAEQRREVARIPVPAGALFTESIRVEDAAGKPLAAPCELH